MSEPLQTQPETVITPYRLWPPEIRCVRCSCACLGLEINYGREYVVRCWMGCVYRTTILNSYIKLMLSSVARPQTAFQQELLTGLPGAGGYP